MVRDNPDSTAGQKQNQKQNQNQHPKEVSAPQRAPRAAAESRGETETWQQGVEGAGGLPTHFRLFRSAAEYKLVRLTFGHLQHSGYYWGAMTMEEAHGILTDAPLGNFLIRDSVQPEVFFTLSYQSDGGPTSVRIQLNSSLLFSLHGSHKTFPSLFDLLTFYTGSSCKLTSPYRKERPERLKQMCRRALIRAHGAERISTLSGLSSGVKDFVHVYPYCI
ncbi:suppressor of cytokine signaling 1-like [Brachionichthys hirsutus]|uniref:suppressor of cytokine signaling 1-like n=1 Tax=Brachionichthys hirsutus TaxID=412623 RepID=UPI003604FA25